jgi:hypothetical protein
MSWSVSAIGKPAAVKAAINQQFEQCLPQLAKNEALKHEHASAALAQESIEAQLNFLIDNQIPCAVRVEANGSAWFTPPSHGYTNHNMKVELVAGFVE